jgi:DNA-directed RNA polymerase specialized sigma24 family protein
MPRSRHEDFAVWHSATQVDVSDRFDTLLAAARAGRSMDVWQLVGEIRPWVVPHVGAGIRRYGRGLALDVNDLVDEVLDRMRRTPPTRDPSGTAGTAERTVASWVQTVTHRLIIDVRRRQARQQAALDELSTEAPPHDEVTLATDVSVQVERLRAVLEACYPKALALFDHQVAPERGDDVVGDDGSEHAADRDLAARLDLTVANLQQVRRRMRLVLKLFGVLSEDVRASESVILATIDEQPSEYARATLHKVRAYVRLRGTRRP